MTGREAISYIESCTSSTRLGLCRTRELLRMLGDPQKKLRFVHVAGTNGKGSACAMLASILETAGYRVGLYTSPYIREFNERIRINGENIPDTELARLTEEIMPLAALMEDHPSQFELITAIAMKYYLEEHCDIVVLEVGLGGELDSTNVIDCPDAAVIMNIGLEHTEYLGDTIASVASAKAGIIKSGTTAVCYDSVPDAMRVFSERCESVGAAYVPVDFSGIKQTSFDLSGQSFEYFGERYTVPLLGAHQLRNASTVIKAVEVLRQKGFDISSDALKTGLANAKWQARFEILRHTPPFVLDGAHNPQCAAALAEGLCAIFPDLRFEMISGVLKDKDYDTMLSLLLPHVKRVYCVRPDSPRAMSAEEFAEVIRKRGVEAMPCGSVESALELALCSGEPVLACGSLYMAGEVENLYPKAQKSVLRRECEMRRTALSEAQRKEYSERISKSIAQSDAYKNADVVLSYMAIGSEACVTLPKGGKRIAYPVTCADGSMKAYVPLQGDAFTVGAFGIKEPDPMRSIEVAPQDIDLVICPCVGFSGQQRLGHGKGYYDRFLPRCENAKFVAAAFEAQRISEFPTEPFDVPMHEIVTEN